MGANRLGGLALPDACRYAGMLNQDQLRNRAARLLALALKAREEGHLDNAERFTQRASENSGAPHSTRTAWYSKWRESHRAPRAGCRPPTQPAAKPGNLN